jgi:hypothetical protein
MHTTPQHFLSQALQSNCLSCRKFHSLPVSPVGELLPLEKTFHMDHQTISNTADSLSASSNGFEQPTQQSSHDSATSAPPPPEQGREAPAPVGTLLSQVRGTKVRWLWQHRIPLGKLTTLDGDPCLGKSLLALDIAARVSTGREMPDSTPGIAGGAGVVLIAPEDGLADTIHPRLQRAGADLSRIVSIGTLPIANPRTGNTYEVPFRLPDGLEALLEAMRHVRAKLVIIDPLTTILSSTGTSKDTEMRMALAPVQMLIEHFGAACLMIGYPTKGSGKNPLSRPGGWLPFLPIASSGLMVLRDPTDESKRVLSHVKSTLSAQATNLSFSIVSEENSGDDRPSIRWHGLCLQTLQELLNPPVPVVIQSLGTARQEILSVLEEYYPDSLSVKTLAEELPHIGNANLRKTLKRMAEDGQIKKSARGEYCAFSAPSPSPEQEGQSHPEQQSQQSQ